MQDTIVAIATAHGEGSISVVRLSGDRAFTILQALTKKDSFKTRYAHLCNIYDKHEQLIDEAITLYFKAPYSYTAEDVVEVQCHGGFILSQKILQECINLGARLASPGEFTKRAFVNGRIDLSEAEAIGDLIKAKSEDAAMLLARQLKGSLKDFVEEIRQELMFSLAHSEVNIDYAEEDLPLDIIQTIQSRLEVLKELLNKTLIASESRSALMEGFKVSIVGKPNVGKSSLLNNLLNFERAIVSDIAGTTRDTIEESLKIGTHLIKIIDTAGIRSSNDVIEAIGIERSKEAIVQSDIVLALFDGSRGCDSEDEAIINLLREHQGEKEIIVLINKKDLEQHFDITTVESFGPVSISSKESNHSLIQRLESFMNAKNSTDALILTSLRQVEAVKQCANEIDAAFMPLELGELELFSFHLNEAIKYITEISRPYELDEMFDKMFGSFCLGK